MSGNSMSQDEIFFYVPTKHGLNRKKENNEAHEEEDLACMDQLTKHQSGPSRLTLFDVFFWLP